MPGNQLSYLNDEDAANPHGERRATTPAPPVHSPVEPVEPAEPTVGSTPRDGKGSWSDKTDDGINTDQFLDAARKREAMSPVRDEVRLKSESRIRLLANNPKQPVEEPIPAPAPAESPAGSPVPEKVS